MLPPPGKEPIPAHPLPTPAISRMHCRGLGLATRLTWSHRATKANSATFYSGAFVLNTSGTSASEPVTIQPAAGVTDPILDGGGTQIILTVGSDVYLNISGVTIQHGGGPGTNGAGINNNFGGTLNLTDMTFTDNSASNDGGAIDNGDYNSGATATLHVVDSTFTDNSATGFNGGAIDNGDDFGSGIVTVVGSTFSGNSAGYNGGAIDNGDRDGYGTLTVTDSTFSNNSRER